mmetsp:Transcript_37912/g.84683  ORF Transcript_37912/g.84683 Transcript_37912/m.84683 type:complete len:381 (+) Transcript_37912:1436-2578(+)
MVTVKPEMSASSTPEEYATVVLSKAVSDDEIIPCVEVRDTTIAMATVSAVVGSGVGPRVGNDVGSDQGFEVGIGVIGVGGGVTVGTTVGRLEGGRLTVGTELGAGVGVGVGWPVGCGKGACVGDEEGPGEGGCVLHQPSVKFEASRSAICTKVLLFAPSITAPAAEESVTTKRSYGERACSQMPSCRSPTRIVAALTPAAIVTVPEVPSKSPAVAQSSFASVSLKAVESAAVYDTVTALPFQPRRRTSISASMPSSKGPMSGDSMCTVGSSGSKQALEVPICAEHMKPASTVQFREQPSPAARFPSSQPSAVVRAPSPQMFSTGTTWAAFTSTTAAAATASSPASAAASAALTGIALAGTDPATISATATAVLHLEALIG